MDKKPVFFSGIAMIFGKLPSFYRSLKRCFCSYQNDDIELEIEADFSDLSNSSPQSPAYSSPKFSVTLPSDYAPSCPFSDKFFSHLESLGSYSPSDWENRSSDNDCDESNLCKSPPTKRHVQLVEHIEIVESGDKKDNFCDVSISRELPRKLPLSDKTNVQKSDPIEPLSSQSTSDPKAPSTSTEKKKRKRTSSKLIRKKFVHSPPWFLDVNFACFTCRRFVGNNVTIHLAHKPKNPLFLSVPLLDEESAKQWAILFDQLISVVKVHFEANSSAHLLQILADKVPQSQRPLAWSNAQKYVLSIYHDMFYDAIKVEEVKLSPPNSLKVLSDELYFRKVMGVSSLNFKQAVNRL
jgi:hypothetical protein